MSWIKREIKPYIKPLSGFIIEKHRLATASKRALPEMIIIGAQKSGTTSLFHYLSQHPELTPPFKKEIHYFDGGTDPSVDAFSQGESWYRSHFPTKRKIKGSVAFEASPLYLFHPFTPQRIHSFAPSIKLIAVLRNPTERAISHYFHEKKLNREELPIMDALLAEDSRLQPVIEAQDYKSETFMCHSYKSRGLYYDQLVRWLDYFPRENLLILESERFFAQPFDGLQRICEFLGVNTGIKDIDVTPQNVGSNKTKVAPEVVDYLDRFFRPHNEKLYSLIGEDWGW